jgi:thiamine phosphate synthase YjbQ (UPF0047 family)
MYRFEIIIIISSSIIVTAPILFTLATIIDVPTTAVTIMYLEHHNTWHENTGHSHIRSTLVGPSLIVSFKDKSLMLGTWQQIVLLEMDSRPTMQDHIAGRGRVIAEIASNI